MKQDYIKNLNNNLLSIENIEEKEKRHEFESLVFNRDITNSNIKQGLDEIKNY
ncbi:hypothetical protein R9X47_26340 [Wukongibacter baidiensis]|uniref:hypothetical protein n=1 Tax=Wukongibacter baidiensis TaxID=1723361 RepID=UPI003D7FDC91